MKDKISVVLFTIFFLLFLNITPIYATEDENVTSTNTVIENEASENNTIKEETAISEETEKQEDKKEDNKKEENDSIKKIEKKIIRSKSISFNCTHTGNLNSKQYIRKKAKLNSKKTVVIKRGKKVTILDEKDNFYKIKYKKGKKKYIGFIKKKYIVLNANFTLATGKTRKLKTILTPNDSTDKIIYKSNNKNVAIVNSNGEITARKRGQVIITAKTESGKKDYVIINVKKGKASKKEYMRLNKIAYEISKKCKNVKRIVYGKSILEENLEAYEITGNGSNSKVIFIETGLHGYEDEYPKDAKVFVKLANKLIRFYAKNPEELKDYTMVVVPCANPDGTLYGKNNYRANKKNAFGRCTYKGIDMNRDFKDKLFKARESRKLRNLMNKYKDRIKINIDVHGWEDSVLGDKKIVKKFIKYVGNKTNRKGQYGGNQGFIIDYTRKKYKAHSALVEFKNSKSVKAENVEKAISSILDIY